MGIGALKAGGRLVGVIWGGDKCARVRGERTGVVVAWRQLEFLAWAQIVQRGGGLQIEADGGRIRLDADLFGAAFHSRTMTRGDGDLRDRQPCESEIAACTRSYWTVGRDSSRGTRTVGQLELLDRRSGGGEPR